jgi:dihydroorotase
MRTIIEHGTIVNEGKTFKGSLILDSDHIENVIVGETTPCGSYDHHVDATGCLVLPGIIDEHVHFREPGLTDKADIESESRAAAWGGVTTFFDMPNTKPATTSKETWEGKMTLGKTKSHVNYAFFYGATNNNADSFKDLDATHIPGIKLFMGASTGNMLVDRKEALEKIYAECARLGLPLMTHCEDTNIINHNMAEAKAKYGEDPDISLHPLIRSEEACYNSSSLAVKLATKYGTHLHIAHLSTAKELGLLPQNNNTFCEGPFPTITGEAVLAHLLFTNNDYATRKALIKCNPSVKTTTDREALRLALTDGKITCIGTDHAPHKLSDKQGGCAKAASGMPMLQFSLVSMLNLVDEGVLTVEELAWLMCHNPARLFSVKERGFLRPGYKADITLVRRGAPWTLTENLIQSKCGWSPLTGEQFRWRVVRTICNGHTVFDNGKMDEDYRGEAVEFKH